MYRLEVVYSFDLSRAPHSARARTEAVQGYVSRLPGVKGVEVETLDAQTVRVVSSWDDRDTADRVLSNRETASDLSHRAGILSERPDAIGVMSS